MAERRLLCRVVSYYNRFAALGAGIDDALGGGYFAQLVLLASPPAVLGYAFDAFIGSELAALAFGAGLYFLVTRWDRAQFQLRGRSDPRAYPSDVAASTTFAATFFFVGVVSRPLVTRAWSALFGQ